MRFASRAPITRGMVVLAGVVLICSYAVVQWTGRFDDGLGQAATPQPPPPGVVDPVNRGILIEAGTFISGSDDWDTVVAPGSPYSKRDEYPRRRTVQSFWMQEHEVTNEEYRRFDAGHAFSNGEERHPVVNVTWREAMAYAVSVGGSLPTEVQWEFAARGSERRKYPWGDSEPTCERVHFRSCDPRGAVEVMARPEGATTEGIHDLAGNVAEWVAPIWFDPGRTPLNDDSRRLRGGSFLSPPFALRAAHRVRYLYSGFESEDVGFRVVWALADEGN
ncbi:MAG: SUMF1/EgtB/PvdO family nonheme iron enzyme [Gammaproteobacteria bacterium]|nr:SUMF1/EgtB/PvdO family nonheme iron enzyme [Gammaproteobacteria bacterium]